MYGNLDPIEHRAERVVIVLVGLIGAGKVRVRHFSESSVVVSFAMRQSTLRFLCTQRTPE